MYCFDGTWWDYNRLVPDTGHLVVQPKHVSLLLLLLRVQGLLPMQPFFISHISPLFFVLKAIALLELQK